MMGLVKEYMLERHDEEMGASPLSWSDVKRARRFLLATEETGATWFSVLQRIDTLSGDAPCGIPWGDVRQMLHNLGELYFCDELRDLYGQIAHMSDQYDSLGDKVEQHREDEEFEERLSRDD